ncbi:hypothetical protein D3C77_267070 [compost metagenome]
MSNHIDPKIQEIIDRHAAATPDWEFNGNEIVSKQNPKCGIGGFLTDADNEAAVMAHADRAYLLSEYKRLQEENKELQETANKFNEFAPQYAEFERMKEALEWMKQRFDGDWTYEIGIGEVVDEIIQKFDSALKG